jgi:hypothetical protein
MRLCGVIGFRRSRYLSLARYIDVTRTRALYTFKKIIESTCTWLIWQCVCVCAYVLNCARARATRTGSDLKCKRFSIVKASQAYVLRGQRAERSDRALSCFPLSCFLSSILDLNNYINIRYLVAILL